MVIMKATSTSLEMKVFQKKLKIHRQQKILQQIFMEYKWMIK